LPEAAAGTFRAPRRRRFRIPTMGAVRGILKYIRCRRSFELNLPLAGCATRPIRGLARENRDRVDELRRT